MVSLIVPCYNAEAYIDRCLTSILSQTFRDIELILVNDGSTDHSHQMIEGRRAEIEEKLTRFLYIQQENQGVGAACSNGFAVATGEYVCLLDSDDMLLPESIRMQSEHLDTHPEHALVRTNGYYADEDDVDAHDRLLEVNGDMKVKEDVFEDIFNSTTYLWPGTYMIRMSVLDRIYPDHRIYPSRSGQNLQFVMMAAYKNRAGFIDVPLMKYVVRRESLSHFSGGDVLNRQLKAMEGYEDIRRYLIRHYIDQNEQAYWLHQTDLLYARCHMQLALQYQNTGLMKQAYKKYCLLEKPDYSIRLLYLRLVNPFAAFCLRCVRKATGIIRKL